MLDLWQNNAAVDSGFDPKREGNAMPEGFGDSFAAAWHEGQLFGSSIAHANARQAALDQYLTEVKQNTGKTIDIGSTEGGADPWQLANDAGEKLGIKPLPDDEIDRRAAAVSGDAHKAYTAEREQTFGGKVGSVIGSLASGTVDPINLVGLAVAPEAELGVVSTAATWGAIGAGSQGLNEAIQAPFREQVQPGYAESGQAASNILMGGAGAALLGGGFKAAGAAWARMKTGDWPRSVRDAGNIVESEAQVHDSNILPGPEGIAAHTEALSKSIDDIVAGRAVETPESVEPLFREPEAKIDQMMDERDAAAGLSEAAKAERATSGERIDTAAIKVGGKIYTGHTHTDALDRASKELKISSNEFLAQISGSDNVGLDGFLTTEGRFVSRKEAYELQDKFERQSEAPELPFAATAKEAQAEQHAGSLAGRLEGFGLTADDASDLADRVIAAKSDDEARAILNEAMARPQTIAGTVPSAAEIAKAERLAKWADDFEDRATVSQLSPEARATALADPKAEQAMTTELERLRDSGQGGMIPTGVDEKGEPTYRLLDEAIQDAKNDADAADQIEACLSPPAEEAAE